ncbi:MAG: isoprenylcysteine carboxylmethyltransferase family protein [Thermomicrobiales bacterium]
MDRDETDGPDAITFPPLIYLAGLGLSLVGRLCFRTPIAPKWLSRQRRKTGIALIAAGVATAIWGVRTFQEAGTNISVHQPATALVERGPFRYSRNPIYISMTAVYSGITLLLNNLWGFLLLPAVLAVVQRGVIEREEQHLRARFGDAYDDYTRRVPRWLRLPTR